jgi:hypothetical protein
MTLRLHVLSVAVALVAAGCSCNNFAPVDDCNGVPCPDGGGGGTSGTGGGAAGGTAGGDAGGTAAGGDAGGMAAGGDAGGMAAGGDAGGATAGGSAGGMAAGGMAAGGAAGGMAAGGSAGGMTAGGAAGGATSVDGGAYDFCGEIARRECDYLIRCTTTPSSAFGNDYRPNNLVASSQRVACEAREREACEEGQAGFARGRTQVNLTALRTCLDAAFPSGSCQRDQNLVLTACDQGQFTTGAVADGGLCTSDIECTRGFCFATGGAACGTCRGYANPDAGTGANCTRDSMCAPGTYCRILGGGFGTCQQRVAADAGCTSTASCQLGLICPDPTSNSRTCQPGKPEGALCVKGRLECARTAGDFELLCATEFTPDGGVDRCTRRFNTQPGRPCNTGEQVQGAGVPAGPSCLDSEYCENGLCATRRAVGMPCGTNSEACVAGARCVQGVCAATSDQGGPCGSGADCRSLLSCTGNMCQPSFVGVGVMCSLNGAPTCIPGAYCPFTMPGMQASCVAQKANGQVCMGDRECLSGDCAGGMCTNVCWR